MDEPSRLHDRQTDKARAVRIRDAFSAALAGDERTQRAARRWDRQLEATFRAKKRAEAEAQYTGLCSELGIAESDLTGRPVEGMDIQADGHEFRAILPRAPPQGSAAPVISGGAWRGIDRGKLSPHWTQP